MLAMQLQGVSFKGAGFTKTLLQIQSFPTYPLLVTDICNMFSYVLSSIFKINFPQGSPLPEIVIDLVLYVQVYVLTSIAKIQHPGAPLTYFSVGGLRVIFLGLKFWPKVIFWVYERYRDFFGSQRKTEELFWVAKKGLRNIIFGYAKKSSDFFG